AAYMRAHLYFLLAQYFCEDYDPATSDEKMGLPIVTRYEPTGDSDKYPGRSSLEATYSLIVSDVETAEEYVLSEGKVNSAYITRDAVKAFKARLALIMHDYDTALLSAKELIDGGKYVLCSDAATFANAWKNDNLSETIWQVAMIGPDDIGNSFRYFIYNSSGVVGEDKPQYIPEDWVLDLYDKANDIRYSSWFNTRDITTPVAGRMTLMVKYPGNPLLYSSVTNYVNMPKVFRISEMYLIAAEAASNKPGQEAVASKYLNDLKESRIKGWKAQVLSGISLTNAIREERVRELFCEGHRMSDIKRWHIGFSRSAGQNPSIVMPGDSYASLRKEADDPFFLWPIPTSEMEANPQMTQNPAYKN
ncbi:MAG: RagB/SusD family nutrient uptake outer membrane protein, partial [Bacteroides sp.]|nr:RagB/SusD family nutrient uptake outer membrane protein [Bacteroides sp.]